MQLSTKQVDGLNIILILLSACLSYFFPLQVFVIGFLIISPLHYLTEINWLHEKEYFSKENKKICIGISIITALFIMLPHAYAAFDPIKETAIGQILLTINQWSNGLIFLCFILAFGSLFAKKKWHWLAILAIGLIMAYFLNSIAYYKLIIGMMLPTIIHVYVFTLLFMLYGVKKSKSKLGYASIILAIIIPFVFIFIDLQETYAFSEQMKSIYMDNGFYMTPITFAQLIGISDGTTFSLNESLELRLMMFISFIYLYHYLNWFSKTSTIAWHKSLDWKKAFAIGIAWIIMMAILYFNFKIGFLIISFISFLHILLEFPLNFVTIKSIFTGNK